MKLRDKISTNDEFKNMDVSILLIAPVQRIARYKILTEAVLDVLKYFPDEYELISSGEVVKKLLDDVSKFKYLLTNIINLNDLNTAFN